MLDRIDLEKINAAANEPHDGTNNIAVHIQRNGRLYSVWYSKPGETVGGAVRVADNVPQVAVKALAWEHGRVSASKMTAMYHELQMRAGNFKR